VDVAKGLISTNKQRIEKKIWTVKERGSHVVVHECFTGDEEANFIMEEIGRLMIEKGRMLNDIAVMYRVNAQSRALEESCLRYGIRYRIIGGIRFYHRREVKDLISFLRVINNPGDQISLLRVINIPPRGLGAKSIEKIIMCSRREHLSLYEVIRVILDGKISDHQLSSKSLKALDEFVSTIEELRASNGVIDISQTIEMLLEKIRYRDHLEKAGNLEDRWDNVLELKSMAQQFISGDSSGDLTALLEHMSLVADVDTVDENSDGITLITLHQAKGLEFPVVFMTGMEEGLLPHYRAMESEEEIEEERRLCYVGITRAQQKLYMTRAFRRGLMGSSGSNIPSRFLQELPQNLLSGPKLLLQKPRYGKVIEHKDGLEKAVKEIPIQLFKTGEKIKHKVFGIGIIVSVSGNGLDQELTVAFEGAGLKRLLLEYAPIERV
jgi:DNA helicase-2/ATP-dependent DNA helicase PcrA